MNKKATHKLLTVLLMAGFCFSFCLTPALAAANTDRVGVATTLYQEYIKNGATGKIPVKSNVDGSKLVAEGFIYDAVGLATRVLPFSLDAEMQYYSNVNPTTFYVYFRGRELNDLNARAQSIAEEVAYAAMSLYDTDVERLAYVNEYLVDHCSYQTAAVNNPNAYENAFTAYGCLVEGKAVCEGYTNSMQIICEKLNIPCVKVTGTSGGGNHIWNSVYVDGKWWMLDVTFNDPVGKQNSEDRWQYFLLNMDEFASKGTHVYDKNDFELSKKILTGRTNGQSTAVNHYSYAGLTNATRQDHIEFPVIEDENLVTVTTDPVTGAIVDPSVMEKMTTENKAEELKAKGLFMGDENGFRLEDNMTRIEMGVMVMRMNGGNEEIAQNPDFYTQQCIFTDVPDWAKSAIGFLYSEKLVAGQGNNLFGTGEVTKQDYATVLLRVLGIDHNYTTAVQTALAQGLLTEEQANGDPIATRGDIVDMTYAALQIQQATHTAA